MPVHSMMHMVMRMTESRNTPSKPRTKAITVRLEQEDYERLRAHAGTRNVSLNTVVNEAVSEYGRKLEREKVLERIQRFRHELGAGAPGETRDDAVEILKGLREKRAAQRMERSGPHDADREPESSPESGGDQT